MSENHRRDGNHRPHTGDRPDTGDPAVDRVLDDLDEALSGDAEGHVDAVAEAHRRLQARLAGPTDGPPRPDLR